MSNLTPRALLCDLMDELDAKDGLSRNARALRAFERRRLGTPLEDAVFQRVCAAQPHVPAKVQTWAVDPAPQADDSPGNIYLEALLSEPVSPWVVSAVNTLMFDWPDAAAGKPSPEKPMRESDYNNMMSAKHAENTKRAGRVPRVAPADDLTPIDTSTTAGKIAVMQAHAAGQCCERASKMWAANLATWCKLGQGAIDWNWEEYNYRIATPPPAERKPRTELEAARGRLKQHPQEVDSDSDAGFLLSLVLEIDASPLVTVSGAGSQANIDWRKTDSRQLTPGRYRLVRDDQ